MVTHHLPDRLYFVLVINNLVFIAQAKAEVVELGVEVQPERARLGNHFLHVNGGFFHQRRFILTLFLCQLFHGLVVAPVGRHTFGDITRYLIASALQVALADIQYDAGLASGKLGEGLGYAIGFYRILVAVAPAQVVEAVWLPGYKVHPAR